MNKKQFLFGMLLITGLLSAQTQDIRLGAINFPQAYTHAGNEYPQGFYEVVLTSKDAVPYFTIYNSKQELQFEELAIVKAGSRIGKTSPFHLKKGILKGDEYFHIMVIRPDRSLLAYFLIKK
jgi:hypothetical protein